MREIKFRAWFKGNPYRDDQPQQMVYDVQKKHADQTPFMYRTFGGMIEDSRSYEVMQYTGLKDKNGVEIYEGDIIRLPELYETPENTQKTYIDTGYILFEEGCWNFSDGGVVYGEYDSYDGDFEVIGNRYENPELLEAKHE